MDINFMEGEGLEDYISYLEADASAIRLLAVELDECRAEDMPDKAHSVYVLAKDQLRLLDEMCKRFS